MMEEVRARQDYVDTVSRLFADCDKDNSGGCRDVQSAGCRRSVGRGCLKG